MKVSSKVYSRSLTVSDFEGVAKAQKPFIQCLPPVLRGDEAELPKRGGGSPSFTLGKTWGVIWCFKIQFFSLGFTSILGEH